MKLCVGQQSLKSKELWLLLEGLKVTGNQKPLGSMAERVAALKRKFWSKVQKTDTCWEWISGKNTTGYGIIHFGGRARSFLAHRVSWLLHNGDISKNLLICHRCDNPPCIRPDHLFAGTQKQNMQDASRKMRTSSQKKTHCRQGHPYIGENLRIVSGERRCVECLRKSNREYQRRKTSKPAEHPQ